MNAGSMLVLAKGLNPLIAFLAKHWKPVAAVVAVLVLCSLSFGLGRYGTAEKVQIKEVVKTQTVEVEKKVYVDRIVEKKVYVAANDKAVHREEHTIKHTDGSVEVVKTEDITDKSKTTNVEDKTDTKTQTEVKYVDRVVEKRVEVVKEKPMPDWRVAPMVGVNGPQIPGLLSGDAFDPLKQLTFGGQVERRVLGPVSVGAWGLSSGQVGVLVSLEF